MFNGVINKNIKYLFWEKWQKSKKGKKSYFIFRQKKKKEKIEFFIKSRYKIISLWPSKKVLKLV